MGIIVFLFILLSFMSPFWYVIAVNIIAIGIHLTKLETLLFHMDEVKAYRSLHVLSLITCAGYMYYMKEFNLAIVPYVIGSLAYRIE